MAWDRGTDNGMAEGADAAYESHFFSDRQIEAEYADLLKEARDIFNSDRRLAEAMKELSDDESDFAAIAFYRGSADDQRAARKLLCRAAATAAYYTLSLDTTDLTDMQAVATELMQELDHAR